MELIPILCDFIGEVSRKKSSAKDYDYKLQIRNAEVNTRKLNLNIPDFSFDNNFCIDSSSTLTHFIF